MAESLAMDAQKRLELETSDASGRSENWAEDSGSAADSAGRFGSSSGEFLCFAIGSGSGSVC